MDIEIKVLILIYIGACGMWDICLADAEYGLPCMSKGPLKKSGEEASIVFLFYEHQRKESSSSPWLDFCFDFYHNNPVWFLYIMYM